MERITLPKKKLEEVYAKHSILYNHNQRFIQILIKAVHYCSPLSNGLNVLYSYDDAGRDLNYYIYNSTPKLLTNLRANQLHSLLCPVNKRWGNFVEIDPQTNKKIPNTVEAQSATGIVFNKIDESNLHEVLKSFFLDLNIGCAAMWVEYVDNTVNFIPISGITVMPDINKKGSSNCFWRRVITKDEFKSKYPNSTSASNSYADGVELYYIDYGYIKDDKSDGYFLIHAIDRDFKNPVLIEKDSCNHLIIVNDTLRAGEGRGRGVVLNILEDIEYLNDITGSLKRYLQYSADPALLTDTRMPDSLYQLRGKEISSNLAIDRSPKVEPVIWQIPVKETTEIIEMLEAKLQKYFNVLPFGEINQTPVRTATEVAARQAEEQKQTLADLARIANQLLGGIIGSIYDILVKNGEIKPLGPHKHEFLSIQETLQSSEDLNNLLQYGELSQQLNGPMSIPQFNNAKKMDDEIKRLLNIDTSISNTPQETAAFNKAVNQAQQQEQQQKQQASQPTPVQPQDPLSPPQIGVPRTVGR